MNIIKIWTTLFVILLVLSALKLLFLILSAIFGKKFDDRFLNTPILILAGILFFPIMIIIAVAKG